MPVNDPITLDDMIHEASTELTIRARVWGGNMTPSRAKRMAIMEAIRDKLREVKEDQDSLGPDGNYREHPYPVVK